MFKFELGENVADVITGYAGTILARIEYLTGCIQYGVQQRSVDKDGKIQTWEWIDESRLKRGTEEKVILGEVSPKQPAGPQQTPPQMRREA